MTHETPGEKSLNADKRSPHTDALDTLGSVITEHEKRDAIHLAVEPAVAAHTLHAGDDVGFTPDGTVGYSEKPVGIVDPFLAAPVNPGQRFWLVVYPRQITSLRHVWTHPDFVDAEDRHANAAMSRSERWIRDFAAQFPVHYDELLLRAADYVNKRSCWNMGELFDGFSVPFEFWDHYEVVTGCKVRDDDRGSFFSCSC